MKLKIIESGWENFSGSLGMTVFENGVSVDDVSQIESNSISGNISVVDAETGDNVGALEIDAAAQNQPCVSSNLQTMEEIFAEQADNGGASVAVEQAPVAPVSTAVKYTKEQLEVVADKEGIAGLREIGDSLDVKATSIVKLIEDILIAQGEVILTNAEASAPAA